MSKVKFSPKEQLFYDAIEVLWRQGATGFDAQSMANRYYGAIQHLPPFWYQATIATISRVILKLDDAPFVVTKDFSHGRGKKAKYLIAKRTKKNPAAGGPPGQVVQETSIAEG